MQRVLMVSKPVSPPWNDSSKNLVRDLASSMTRYRPLVMGAAGQPAAIAGVESEAVYPARSGAFAPALADNARVLKRLLLGRQADLWHFFFAPNPRSSRVCHAAARLRRAPTVQTICSAPADTGDLPALLFADRSVVLSQATEARVLEAGLAPERVRRIAPAVAPLEPIAADRLDDTRRQLDLPVGQALIVYPGDLEFSSGAELSLRSLAALTRSDVTLVMACRAKTPRAQQAEQGARALARELGIAERVRWLGETRRIHELLGCADIVMLPSETLYAKMDLPLVLIEAMYLERPILVARDTPAEELAEGEAACVVETSVDATGAALQALLDDAESRRQLGARARRAALGRYHPHIMAQRYEQLYDELLGPSAQGPSM
ncbi:MAG: glycosyltransferase family 4 protein [Myxococcales bacterium]|nr:glycosyltransferase family 4 protein [Myxococcales bacterium]